jgi:hypothetical protein
MSYLASRYAGQQHSEQRLLGIVQSASQHVGQRRRHPWQQSPTTGNGADGIAELRAEDSLVEHGVGSRDGAARSKVIVGKGREDDHAGLLSHPLQPATNPQAVAPTKVIIHDRHIDPLTLSLGDRCLGVHAHRLDREVPLPIKQLHQPQAHGWMIVHHQKANLL